VLPIAPAVKGFEDILRNLQGLPRDVTKKSAGPVRVACCCGMSNKTGAMLVTTGNKSEMSVGYATLYGDMNGGTIPLKTSIRPNVFDYRRCATRGNPMVRSPIARK